MDDVRWFWHTIPPKGGAVMAQTDHCACPGCEQCAGQKPCPRAATESDSRCRPCH